MEVVLNDVLETAAFSGFAEQEPLKKVFNWKTDNVRFDNGREQRNQLFNQPIRGWLLNYEMIDKAGRDKLLEMFNRAKGAYATFLFEDSDDYECAFADCSYTAVGGETTVQLSKTYFGSTSESWTENKKKIQPSAIYAPVVKIGSTVKTEGTHFTLDDTTGIINFAGGSSPNGALSAGNVVTANYRFYYKVRFNEDQIIDLMTNPALYSFPELQIIEVLD